MRRSDGFDDLVAAADPALVVVTTARGDELAGCLVGFHAQISIEPQRYAVWLSRLNRTCRVARLASHVAIHFLADDDHALAELFGAETGDDIDKFALTSWTAGPGGVPLLEACPHRLVGRRVTLIDEGGDHACFVSSPVRTDTDGPFIPLRMGAVAGMSAGHEVDGAAPR